MSTCKLKLGIIGGAGLLAACMAGAVSAQASVINVVWNFTGDNSNLGTTETYSSTPVLSPTENITATGYRTNYHNNKKDGYTAQDLYGKNMGSGEQGLGLTNDPTGDKAPHPLSCNDIRASHRSVQVDRAALRGPLGLQHIG